MSWSYMQGLGKLTHDGRPVAIGYSGHDQGLNNAAFQDHPDLGPIPQGAWTIGPIQDGGHLGPLVLPLTPNAGNETTRSGFYIHGDNAALNHSASHGCIILSRAVREYIGSCVVSGDDQLEVVP